MWARCRPCCYKKKSALFEKRPLRVANLQQLVQCDGIGPRSAYDISCPSVTESSPADTKITELDALVTTE